MLVAAAVYAWSGLAMPFGLHVAHLRTAAADEYPAPTNTVAPAVTGSAVVGQQLTSDDGTWTSFEAPTFSSQWQRCDTSGCTDIAGATGSSYTVQAADVDSTLRVKVRATNSTGFTDAFSTKTATVRWADDVKISVTADSGTTSVGDDVTYTLKASTIGANGATGVTITDTLPPNASFVSASTGCTADTGKVTCPIGDLESGGNASVTVVASPTSTGDLTNTAAVSATTDQFSGDDSASVTTKAILANDLALTAAAPSPDPAATGNALTYTFTAKNVGGHSATNVRLTDELPSTVVYSSASAPGDCSVDGRTVTCALGDIASGGTASATVVVTPTLAGSLSNTASVASDQTDGDTSNNTATAHSTVRWAHDLMLSSIARTPTTPVVGNDLSYDVTAVNAGGVDASSVQIVDTIPSGTTFKSATIPGGSCTSPDAKGTLTCSLSSLGVDKMVTATIVVTPTTTGTLTNTASVEALKVTDGDDTDNSKTDTSTAIWAHDLAIGAVTAPDHPTAGNPLTYTLTATNNGGVEATGVKIVDTLASSVTFGSATVDGEPCAQSGVTVTCDVGDLGPGDSVDATVQVTPTTSGTITNTATVAGTDADQAPADNTATTTTSIGVPAPKVLILDTTVRNGLDSPEAQEAASLGYDVRVVNGATWDAMSTADFATYRGLILGDRSCSSSYTAAETNAATWGAAVNGNVIINGTDPVLHGRLQLVNSGVAFALAASGKTGLYASLSCYYNSAAANTPVPVLSGIGSFTVQGASCSNSAHIVATHPALAGLTDDSLSNWYCSVHEIFNSWPSDFLVLAIASGIGNSYTAADGTVGTPYILARGEGLSVISDISLAPDGATLPVGSAQTLTATVSQNGDPVSGKTVTLNVVSGPNAGLSKTATTGADGKATLSYTSATAGTDTLEASFVDAKGATQRSGRVTVTWTGGRTVGGKILDGDHGNAPLAGVTVSLCRGNQTSCATQTTSGSDGTYRFTGVAPGTYLVSATSTASSSATVSRRVRVKQDDSSVSQDIVLRDALPQLRVTVSVSPAHATVGEPVTFTYTMTNDGNAKASNVEVTASIDTGNITFCCDTSTTEPATTARRLAATSPDAPCLTTATTATCSFSQLSPGKQSTMSMIVSPTSAGTLTSTAEPAAAETDGPDQTADVPVAAPTPSSGGSSSSSGGAPATTDTTATATTDQPPPVTGVTTPPPPPPDQATLQPVGTGTVLVNGQPLTSLQTIPVGATVDATNGIVQVTTVSASGQAQVAYFFGGVFQITQATVNGVTVLKLQQGDFDICATPKTGRHLAAKGPKKTKAKKSSKVVRSLWGEGSGNFRTQGRYASATVRGTFWLTADRCDGTLVRVNQGTVSVRDTVRNKTIVLTAGQSYLSLAP